VSISWSEQKSLKTVKILKGGAFGPFVGEVLKDWGRGRRRVEDNVDKTQQRVPTFPPRFHIREFGRCRKKVRHWEIYQSATSGVCKMQDGDEKNPCGRALDTIGHRERLSARGDSGKERGGSIGIAKGQ